MDYPESLEWLHTLPDFERTGEFSSRADLVPMRALLAELGDPHLGRPTVHVAGSKGKGSTGAIAEAIVRGAGNRTGYYISPHLHRYNERMRIDAAPIEQPAFAAAMTAVRDAIDRVAHRFADRQFLAFDALTAAAFVAFRDAAIDVQIVEVGLGGTLDSTNVFDATDVVVITPISLEHTAVLGNTIGEIAAQKAGIITTGTTVIVSPQRESAIDVISAVAREKDATLVEVAKVCQLARTGGAADGQDFKLKTERATYAAKLPLAGRHQLDNAATAVLACEALATRAGFELTPQHVRAGLGDLSWPGRLEMLKQRPRVIVDGAHNGDSAKRMVAALRSDFGLAQVTFLFGTLSGKDVAAMVDAVANAASEVYASAWSNPRAADPRELAAAFRPYDVPVQSFDDLPDAYEAAAASAGERGAVVAFGSIAFTAALREYLLGIESDMIMLSMRQGRPEGA